MCQCLQLFIKGKQMYKVIILYLCIYLHMPTVCFAYIGPCHMRKQRGGN